MCWRFRRRRVAPFDDDGVAASAPATTAATLHTNGETSSKLGLELREKGSAKDPDDDWPHVTLPHTRNVMHRPGLRGDASGGNLASLRRRVARGQWVEVPVFVSSTFLDMHAERDLLSARALRRLERRLQDDGYKVKIREIDLRWGITQEETEQGLGVPICLGLVQLCRPFFIGLIGRRYGWRPDAPMYGLDGDGACASWIGQFPSGRSVTELEMFLASAPYDDGDGRPVTPRPLVYERDSAFLASATFAEDAARNPQLRRHYEQDPDMVDALKRRLAARGVRVQRYACKWREGQCVVSGDGLLPKDGGSPVGLLEEMVVADLEACIRGTFDPAPRHLTSLDQARNDHAAFAEDCGAAAIGRDEIVARLASFLRTGILPPASPASDEGATSGLPKCVVLVAPPGLGKSAVVARLVTEMMAGGGASPRVHTVAHFVGPVVGSSGVRQLLPRLCKELASIAAAHDDGTASSTSASSLGALDDYVDLVNKDALSACMARAATCAGRIAIVVDALNQLDDVDGAHELRWFPRTLPDGVSVVVSAVEGRCTEALRRRNDVAFVSLSGLEDASNRCDIVRRLLGAYGKRLAETPGDGDGGRSQMDWLVSKASANSPLYLALACEEVRLFGDYGHKGDAVTSRIRGLPEDVPGMLLQVLRRLEGAHGERLIADALSLLASSRHGLGTDELRRALALCGHPSDARGLLPGKEWFTLEVALRPFLKTSVSADGEQLLGFFHRQLALAIRLKYLERCHADCAGFRAGDRCVHLDSPPTSHDKSRQMHATLATLFEADARDATATLRRLSESLYHAAMCGKAAVVTDKLCSLFYLDARVALGDAEGVAADYAWTESLCGGHAARFRLFFMARVHEFKRHPARGRVLLAALNAASDVLVCDEDRAAMEAAVVACGAPLVRRWNTAAAEERCIGVLEAHTAAVGVIAASGNTIASASHDGTARLWDARTGQCHAVLEGHAGQLLTCVFSRDGSVLATTAGDNSARMWDVGAGRVRHVLRGHTDAVLGCCLSHDGRLLLTCSADKTARVWTVETGECLHVLTGHTDWVNRCCFASDDGALAATVGDRTLRLWDATTGVERDAAIAHSEAITAIAWERSRGLLATASNDATARLWAVRDGALALARALEGHADAVLLCVFSTDGEKVVTASKDKSVRVWFSDSGACAHELRGHAKFVCSVAFLMQGDVLATASFDRRIALWDVESGAHLGALEGHSGGVLSCAAAGGGGTLVSASADKSVRVWDLSSLERTAAASGGAGSAVAQQGDTVANTVMCAFSPDGSMLAVAAMSGFTRLIECRPGGGTVAMLSRGTGAVTHCAFSPNSKLFAVATMDATCHVWDVSEASASQESANCAVLKGHALGVVATAFSPDGGWLLTASDDRTARLWSVRPGVDYDCVRVFAGHGLGLRGCAFSPDSRMCATISNDKTARLWDVHSGQCTAVLEGHTASVTHCAFSPDGLLLLTTSNDKTCRGWDVRGKGACAFVLEGHTAAVVHCALSVDGLRIATAGDDRTVRVWAVQAPRRPSNPFASALALLRPSAGGAHKAVPTCVDVLRDGHETAVTNCAFSPDGRFVLSVCSAGAVLHRLAAGDGIDAKAWPILLPGGAVKCAVRPATGSGADTWVAAVAHGTDAALFEVDWTPRRS